MQTTLPDPIGTWLLLASVWIALLATPRVLAGLTSAESATATAFWVAAALTLWARGWRRPANWTGPVTALALGAAAGYASLPFWIASIATLGLACGLEPHGASGVRGGGPTSGVAVVVAAPVFEELIYRERLIGALRPHVGVPVAVGVSSALFALPHLDPWTVLGTFVVGLALGSLFCATGSVALCIGLHAGLNAATRS